MKLFMKLATLFTIICVFVVYKVAFADPQPVLTVTNALNVCDFSEVTGTYTVTYNDVITGGGAYAYFHVHADIPTWATQGKIYKNGSLIYEQEISDCTGQLDYDITASSYDVITLSLAHRHFSCKFVKPSCNNNSTCSMILSYL